MFSLTCCFMEQAGETHLCAQFDSGDSQLLRHFRHAPDQSRQGAVPLHRRRAHLRSLPATRRSSPRRGRRHPAPVRYSWIVLTVPICGTRSSAEITLEERSEPEWDFGSCGAAHARSIAVPGGTFGRAGERVG